MKRFLGFLKVLAFLVGLMTANISVFGFVLTNHVLIALCAFNLMIVVCCWLAFRYGETKQAERACSESIKLTERNASLTSMVAELESQLKGVDEMRTLSLRQKTELDEADLVQSRITNAMVAMLAEVASMVAVIYEDREWTGSNLKQLRFRLLDVALTGFRGLQDFTWFEVDKVNPAACKDYAANLISTTEENVTQVWLANFIRFAHGGKPVVGANGKPNSVRPNKPGTLNL